MSYIRPSFTSRPPSIVMGATKVQTLLLPQLIFLFLICMSSSFSVQSRPLPPNFFHLYGLKNAGSSLSGNSHGFDTLGGTKEPGLSQKATATRPQVRFRRRSGRDQGGWTQPRGNDHAYVNGVYIDGSRMCWVKLTLVLGVMGNLYIC